MDAWEEGRIRDGSYESTSGKWGHSLVYLPNHIKLTQFINYD